jgi:hypothetical protein
LIQQLNHDFSVPLPTGQVWTKVINKNQLDSFTRLFSMNQKNKLKIAEIVGLCFGDGSLTFHKSSRKLRFQLRGDASEDRSHYDNYIIPLFNKHIAQPLMGKDVCTVESKKSHFSYGFAIYSDIVGNYLHQFGVPIGRKGELPIPEWIKCNDKYLASFIRGLLDTDGSVFCQKNYTAKDKSLHRQIWLKISTTSLKLAEDIQEGLRKLGILSYLRSTKPNRKHWKTSYHIEVVHGKNVDIWFKIIGSNSPKHITKYQVWQKFGFCPPYTTLKQRRKFLSGEFNPKSFYDAGVPEIFEPLALRP